MSGINDLVAKLEQIGSRAIRERMAEKARGAAHDECLRGFVQQRNPYGAPWAPRKDRRGGWPILQKTGAGVEGLTSQTSGERISLRIKGLFRFHQSGTSRMVAREIFPDPSRGLGSWTRPIQEASLDAVRELMK